MIIEMMMEMMEIGVGYENEMREEKEENEMREGRSLFI